MAQISIPKRTSLQHAGTVYVAVLGVSLVVAVISIAAMHVARIEMREVIAVNEISRARLAAESGIEYAITRMRSSSLWRSNFTSGISNLLGAGLSTLAGNGQFEFTITDSDGDLNDNNQDNVTLRSVGIAGVATSVVEVLLQPSGAGLNCLESALHAGSGIGVKGTIVSNQMVSANYYVYIDGGATIQGDVWSTKTITGNVVGSSYQNQSPPREMPDSASLFDYYLANGTSIPISSIPGKKIEKVVISPGCNPYMGGVNAQGIYVIDCQGSDLEIENARIEATLVILNTNSKTTIDRHIHWTPAIWNFPALMVQNDLDLKWHGEHALSEGSENTNYNPTRAPYDDVTDNDQNDTYPGIIEGLIYVAGNLIVTHESTYRGVIVVEGGAWIDDDVSLQYQSTFLNSPPPGFRGGTKMEIIPGTWKQVVF